MSSTTSLKSLNKELRHEKDDAVREQEFSLAGEMRARELEIQAEIRALDQVLRADKRELLPPVA